MPLSFFYGVDAKSATMSYPTYFQEAKSYYPRHLYISDFKKNPDLTSPASSECEMKVFLRIFNCEWTSVPSLSHIHYSTLSALLQLSFQTFSLAGALSDFYIVSYWSNILLRSQHMAWFNQIRQCVFHWSIYLYLKVNTSVMPKNSILWLLN